VLAKRAERINAKAKGTPIYGVIDWIALLPTLLSLLSLCKKPVNPTPPNPNPSPNSAQANAWSDAWRLKSAAVDNWDGSDYAPATLKRTANQIRKAKRRDGTPITKADAIQAAILSLDDARTSTMADLYSDVCEARHVS